MLHKTAFRKLGWFLVLLVGGVLFSCQKVADEMVDIHELAAPERIVEVDASAATHEVQVYANERFSVEIDGDAASWARLDRHTFAKDFNNHNTGNQKEEKGHHIKSNFFP